jgi:Flp pilus assembly protein TadD
MKGRVLLAFTLLVGSLSAQLETGSLEQQQIASALVSAADLAVPSSARKELNKASGLIARQEFSKAEQRLNKALAIYPNYATAYNNLAVVFSQIGDVTREQQVLEKAVSIDDHFALAYLNLGRLYISNHNFPNAETVLAKASRLNPTDTTSLMLLSYSQLILGHFDDVIATSRKAHTLAGEHALVHRTAANAFEREHDVLNAIAELELFLKEQPSGVSAEEARRELAILRNFVATATK